MAKYPSTDPRSIEDRAAEKVAAIEAAAAELDLGGRGVYYRLLAEINEQIRIRARQLARLDEGADALEVGPDYVAAGEELADYLEQADFWLERYPAVMPV